MIATKEREEASARLCRHAWCRSAVRLSVAALVGLSLIPAASAVAAPAPVTVPVGNSAVTVVGAANEPATSAVPAAEAKPSKPARVSDPLADLAAYTLDALKTNGAAPSTASIGSVLAPPTPAAFPAPASSIPALSLSAGATGWSSAIVDTVDVSALLDGAIAVNPASAARVDVPVSDAAQRYPTALAQLANLVSSRVKGLAPSSLLQVWLMTDSRRMSVVLTALAQTGTYYQWAGNQPGGFDCSGLTSYAWSSAGVRIPRTSADQINALAPKAAGALKPGDLLYRPGHIGIYLGTGEFMVHSPQTGRPVEVTHWGRVTRMGSPLG